MADESFILTLVGQLDEDGTQKNVESVLKKINKSINESNINKIKIFDKDDLDKQGSAYITGLENIREQILKLLKLDENTGVSIAKIFDDNGAIAKFKVSLEDAIGILKEYNFERAKFSDGSVGAVMTSGTGVNPTIQIASGYETINQNVQKATGSVKIFTDESENNLNRLSSKIIQTSTNLTLIDEESKKAIRSIQNVLKGASEITIGTGDNAQTIRGFDSIESFLARYQKFAEGFKGNPVLNLNVDDNGTLRGFTARIETTQGAVQNLVFRLRQLEEEETFFQYQGANVNDSTFDVQVEAITKLEQKYENFKSKLQDGASFKFIDTTDTLNKLKVIEDVIKGLKNNVGLNHIIDIENLEKVRELTAYKANERRAKTLQDEIALYQRILEEHNYSEDEKLRYETIIAEKRKQLQDAQESSGMLSWDKILNHIANTTFDMNATVTNAYDNMMNSFVNFGQNMFDESKSLSQRVKDLFADFAKTIWNMMMKLIMQGLAMKMILGLTGLFGGSPKVPTIAPMGDFVPDAEVRGLNGYAKGGVAEGWSIVGEKGPELVNFSNPARVYTADQTRNALSGGNGGNLNIKFDIKNNTNQQIEAKQTGQTFDGESYVIGVVLNAVATNQNGMRSALKGALST